MFFSRFDVTFKEVPGEISLTYSICGCPLKCKGCHSPELRTTRSGEKLKRKEYINTLIDYRGYATCVLFMGGEWEFEELIFLLKIAKTLGYKTCLYTGLNNVSKAIEENLDYLKTGPWIKKRGGLDSENTNQIFKEVATGKKMNSLFHKK